MIKVSKRTSLQLNIAYVREVNDRISAFAPQNVQEGERDNIDGVVLTIERQPLLSVRTILAPVAIS